MPALSAAPRKSAVRSSPPTPEEVSTFQWIISLMFWGQLLLAAAIYAAVALAPKLVTLIELRNEHLITQSQLVWLEQQVEELRQVTEALENDPRILQELARLDLDAARPGESRLELDSDLMLQSRITEERPLVPDVTRRWYEPIIHAFALNQNLRSVALLSAIALILISFTFFHASQAERFSIGVHALRDSILTMTGRYRRA